MLRLWILTWFLLWMLPGSIQASTWNVERDGSADATTIQDAIDLSAVGDTILLGPGNYTESFVWQLCNGSWNYPVLAAISVDSLTIRGVSRDDVIIGPEILPLGGTEQRGIVVECAVTAFWVEDVTIQNLFTGIKTYSSGGISGCLILNCEVGVFVSRVDNFTVRSSEIRGSKEALIIHAESAVVDDCVITDSESGLRIRQTPDALVRNTRIEGGIVSILIEAWSTATVENCTFTGAVNASVGLSSSSVELNGNLIGTALKPILGTGVCALSGTGNTVQAGVLESIRLQASTNITFQGNNISPGLTGLAIMLTEPAEPGDYTLDMTGNYWSTSDPDSVAAMIWDGSDDAAIPEVIDFMPLADTAVSTAKTEFGSLKAMFR